MTAKKPAKAPKKPRAPRRTWLDGMAAAGRRSIEARVKDPGLLDVRRSVALAEHLAVNAPAVPTDEEVDQVARRQTARQLGEKFVTSVRGLVNELSGEDAVEAVVRDRLEQLLDELLTPVAVDRAAVRLKFAGAAAEIIGTHNRVQTSSIRAAAFNDIVHELAAPVFADVGIGLNRMIHRFVPKPQQADAAAEVQRVLLAAVGALQAIDP